MKLTYRNWFGWAAFGCGVAASQLYVIQMILGLGFDSFDMGLISIGIIILGWLAIGFQIAHNREKKLKNPLRTAGFIAFIGSCATIGAIMVLSMAFMVMDASGYGTWANSKLGTWEAFRMLSHVTDQDLSDLQKWGLGIQEIMKGILMAIPAIIIMWGTLAFLTAESITEADGALFSFFACAFFCIEVWMFNLTGVILY